MDYRLKSIYEQMLVNPASVPCSSSKNLNEAYKKVVIKSTVDFTEDILMIEKLLEDEFSSEPILFGEALIGANAKTREKYVPIVNNLLSKNYTFSIGKSGEKGNLLPYPNQQISSLEDNIKGTVNGVETFVRARDLYKSEEMKGTIIPNKGHITEGFLAAAIFTRLIKDTDITEKEVFNTLSEIGNTANRELIKYIKDGHSITDTFLLKIKLYEAPSKILFGTEKEHKLIKSEMPGIISSIVRYINDVVSEYARHFYANGRPDKVSVIADGVSNQTGTKTDVTMSYNEKDENGQPQKEEIEFPHFYLSVKSGTTKQMGQHSGGGQRASIEEKFQNLEALWNKFGISIQECKEDFINSNNITEGYQIAYGKAVEKFKEKFDHLRLDQEKAFLTTLIEAIHYFATLNDPKIRLVHFTYDGYYILDFKKLNRLFESDNGIELDAMLKADGKRPIVVLYDKVTGQNLLSIRMKPEGDFIRNLIQKEPLLVFLTKVKGFQSTKIN